MRPDQLPLLTSLSAPSVHPDGTWAVVAASRPDFDADSYVGQLFRVPLDGSVAPRRITRGTADGYPVFSPDGSVIATIVLLNDARTWATPRGALRHALRFVVAVLGPLCSRSCAMLSLSPVPGRAAYAIWPCFFIDALRFTPTVFRGPFRVRAFVLVRWPRTGSPRRCRIPR